MFFKAYYENGNVRYEGSYLNKMPIGTHYHYKQSKEVCDSILILMILFRVKYINAKQ
jgi:antitoxin component YwqK of YwqJK toxin-antitoxin module